MLKSFALVSEGEGGLRGIGQVIQLGLARMYCPILVAVIAELSQPSDASGPSRGALTSCCPNPIWEANSCLGGHLVSHNI